MSWVCESERFDKISNGKDFVHCPLNYALKLCHKFYIELFIGLCVIERGRGGYREGENKNYDSIKT